MYPSVQLFIDGVWCAASDGATLPVQNPATGDVIGQVARATRQDMERAAAAVRKGFEVWRHIPALERGRLMRSAAEKLRGRAEAIAPLLTMEQGKPLKDALGEARGAADVIEWFADEGRRAYGRIIPARAPHVTAAVVKEPVGPVAGFTPWNYPISQAVRKISAALAAGCSIVVKAAEETPASTAAMVRCFEESDIPPGVVSLLFGVPAEISEFLIPHPAVRAVTFTGSTVVGKRLTELAGLHMKRCTMELGGHAPCLVFEDADIGNAVSVLADNKFHNAGQVCIAPTRLLVQDAVYDDFLEGFVEAARSVRVGDGLDDATVMGPLANARRLEAVDELVRDAVGHGARLVAGGRRLENRGHFYEPTVLADVPVEARIMAEEPFGPVAIVNRFDDPDDAFVEANRLDYALAAYGFARSSEYVHRLSTEVEAGMVSINHYGLAYAEVPFGGIKDSGYGNEGGIEALNDFMNTKFVSTRHF
jgi:succinate-semialdehyde dehydrogenase/glutarate-semialdehyde dehydrogenase